MAEILGTSLKTVQSFEQGWRKVPVHVERQLLFLMNMKKRKAGNALPCWDIKNCSVQARQDCPAWEFNAGNLCWFINGTICLGKPQNSWSHKMKVCRKCEVFANTFGGVAPKSISQWIGHWLSIPGLALYKPFSCWPDKEKCFPMDPGELGSRIGFFCSLCQRKWRFWKRTWQNLLVC